MLFFLIIIGIILTIGTNEVNKRKTIINRLNQKLHEKEEKKRKQAERETNKSGYSNI